MAVTFLFCLLNLGDKDFTMGLNGTILIFPQAGRPTTALDSIARQAIEAFEYHKLLLPETVNHCKSPKPWVGTFADHIEDGNLASDECVTLIVNPDRITPEMSDLVYLLDVDENGQPSPIELPYIEFSVATKALPIINGYDGETLCTTWAVVGFSYEDARYDEEIHRIRNEKHPIIEALSKVFSSPIGWTVEIG